MKIELTEKQFRRLLDLVYIGNWVLNSTRGDDRIREYDEVESTVFSNCINHGMVPLVESYQGELIPSRAFAEGGIHEAILAYEDTMFFEILAQELALRDMERLRALFDAPLPDADAWPLLRDFHHEGRCTGDGALLTELAAALAQADCPAQMLARLTDFYRTRGVGLLGLGQVFRAESAPGGARLTPVEERLPVRLGDLVGYEKQKQQLLANTESFLAGHHANNVLLYGDAGTGKSTSIQAIANEYAAQGLRLIEIYKDQYALIPAILRQIKSRNYRFILFLDDLSFEEFETEYKYLKAVIEGGLEKKPANVLIYATSNRRHLVRESFHDRDGVEFSDKHGGDTVQEKLSLANRFGVSIYYGAPTYEEYHEIVAELAARHGIEMEPAELKKLATQWEMNHGGLSGRTAQQFIDHLLGTC